MFSSNHGKPALAQESFYLECRIRHLNELKISSLVNNRAPIDKCRLLNHVKPIDTKF